jgi:hypothetical protein
MANLPNPGNSPKGRASHLRGKERRKHHLARVKELFEQGWPVLRIAKDIGMSRVYVNSCLHDMGIPLPSISDGNRKAAALLTPEQRKERAEGAHAAIRRRGRPKATQNASAVEKQATMQYVGFGEAEFSQMLERRGFNVTPQAAWNGYNIDIMVGSVAVEIHHFTTHPFYRTQTVRRAVEMLCAGLHMFYIQIDPRTNILTEAAADQFVAFFDLVSAEPSAIGQYRVISGDGQRSISAERKFDEDTAVIGSYCTHKARLVDH